MKSLDKRGLYEEISVLRKRYGIHKYPITMSTVCEKAGILIGVAPFTTEGLRGMAIKGDVKKQDVILLSENRTEIERNIDCGHEFVHLGLQRDYNIPVFNCFEKIRPKQNTYLEWQANEGSAELLIPYKILISRIKDKYNQLNSWSNIYNFKETLARQFNVPLAVVQYRIESLKYETSQHISGVPLENIEILSNSMQIRRGIVVKSLNDLEKESLQAIMGFKIKQHIF